VVTEKTKKNSRQKEYCMPSLVVTAGSNNLCMTAARVHSMYSVGLIGLDHTMTVRGEILNRVASHLSDAGLSVSSSENRMQSAVHATHHCTCVRPSVYLSVSVCTTPHGELFHRPI